MFLPLKILLTSRLQKNDDLAHELLSGQVAFLWTKEAESVLAQGPGKNSAALFRVNRFQNNTLFVAVKNPIVGQELRFHEAAIKNKVNASLNQPALLQVRYFVDGGKWG